MTEPLAWPADVQPGRRVRATKKDRSIVLEFTVKSIDATTKAITPTNADWTVSVTPVEYVVEVIPDPLPTAAGVYIDSDGNYWRITEEGAKPRYWSTVNGLESLTLFDPTRVKFTLLVPEGASA